MTTDHQTVKAKIDDIEGLDQAKEEKYEVSGIDPHNSKKLAIKETPFNLDQEK
jgi:hypothetical protein